MDSLTALFLAIGITNSIIAIFAIILGFIAMIAMMIPNPLAIVLSIMFELLSGVALIGFPFIITIPEPVNYIAIGFGALFVIASFIRLITLLLSPRNIND